MSNPFNRESNPENIKQYKQAPMVKWFVPRVLFRAGIKAIVSSLFGNYADRREMESALDTTIGTGNVVLANDPVFDFSQENDLWIDFVADTGDGFNATYSVASLVAKELDVQGEKLQRGNILILGGDQIYPAPTREDYENKFHIPFEAALPYVPNDANRPSMFAIPGNHDWYDGLGNFLKVFCQQRKIGNWETKQRRSYFALKLPHNYWIWGIDIQLSEDIDKPQQHYFERVGKDMKQGDKVILVTAKPAWIYKELDAKDKSYDILQYFIERYITDDNAECMGKTFTLVAILTGDLHHYSHYFAEGAHPVHFIGAGGGGAAMHLTHDLPPLLEKIESQLVSNNPDLHKASNFNVKNVQLKGRYPSEGKSKRLVIQNLLFFWKNKFFGYLFGVFYCLVYWLIQSSTLAANEPYMAAISNQEFVVWLQATVDALGYTPSAIVLCLIMCYGFYSFGDNKKDGSSGPKLYALLFGILLCLGIFLMLWLLASLHDYSITTHWLFLVLFGLEITVAGFLIGGLLMGIYLYTANLIWHNHIDDASASLAIPDYKNFLRMRLTKNGVSIYPLGIDKVTKKWNAVNRNGRLAFKGEEPKYDLIDDVIKIPSINN